VLDPVHSVPVTDSLARVLRDPARLAALWRVTPVEPAIGGVFDRTAELAAQALGTPIGVVVLVEEERQLLAGGFGLPESLADMTELPASWGFCPFALALTGPLALDDARHRPEFARSPLVRELHAVAYAGVPLRGSHGHPLGALCVVDSAPRRWGADDPAALAEVAEVGTAQLAALTSD